MPKFQTQAKLSSFSRSKLNPVNPDTTKNKGRKSRTKGRERERERGG